MMTLYILVVCAILYLLASRFKKSESEWEPQPDSSTINIDYTIKFFFTKLLICAIAAVSFVINFFYVTESVENKLSPDELFIFQLFVALFGIANKFLIGEVLRACSFWFPQHITESSIVLYMARLCVLCDLGNPILSTMISDSLCFKYTWVEHEVIYGYYNYEYCAQFKLDANGDYDGCFERGIERQIISYTPVPTYSKQCKTLCYLSYVDLS